MVRGAGVDSPAHISIGLLFPQANDTGAVSADKVARRLEVRLQELERRYVALVTWQRSMYTSRAFILGEQSFVSLSARAKTVRKLLTEERQRATKWPEP